MEQKPRLHTEDIDTSYVDMATGANLDKRQQEKKDDSKYLTPKGLVASLEARVDSISGKIAEAKKQKEVKIETDPEAVQKADKNLAGKIDQATTKFMTGLREKAEYFNSRNFVAAAVPTAIASMLLPIATQFLASRYPEVNAMLISAPDFVNNFLNLDLMTNVAHILSITPEEESYWKFGYDAQRQLNSFLNGSADLDSIKDFVSVEKFKDLVHLDGPKADSYRENGIRIPTAKESLSGGMGMLASTKSFFNFCLTVEGAAALMGLTSLLKLTKKKE